ncbi:MAG: hypothetical protein K2Q22_15840, partial [Cytophagales bacterium]|nr:hypothetical protein [Cytophagales bacterium]
MSTPSARLAALTQALKAEKEHEHSTFVDFIQKANIAERRAKGVCWYPLRVKETGFGMGEYPFLVVERNNDLDQPHQLGAGKPALLFSNNCENPIEEGVKGTIHFSGNQTLKIILQADDFPEWLDEGKLQS